MKALSSNSNDGVAAGNLYVNQLCVVLWAGEIITYQWYVGYIKYINDDGYMVDHRSSQSQILEVSQEG